MIKLKKPLKWRMSSMFSSFPEKSGFHEFHDLLSTPQELKTRSPKYFTNKQKIITINF